MKVTADKIIIALLSVLIAIGGFLGTKLWEGVDLAKETAVRVEHIREMQKDIREQQKEDKRDAAALRHDLDIFMSDVSDLSLRVPRSQ